MMTSNPSRISLSTLALKDFSEVLGSDAPAPGGGSISALAGCLGADLVSMVCALSIGREELSEHAKLLQSTHSQAQELSIDLMGMVDSDTEAFNDVMAAFRLPRSNDEERRQRAESIQTGYMAAVRSPLAIATECLAVLSLASELIGKSNPSTLSDLGVGAEMALSGLEGAAMNVRINLPSIKNTEYVDDTERQIDEMLSEGRYLRRIVYEYVQSNL